jgi:hypothetical protein
MVSALVIVGLVFGWLLDPFDFLRNRQPKDKVKPGVVVSRIQVCR